ncbi:MAG: hypothetical protein SF187_25850 [Deltaproteobacteria bacterium]|nr:hypothetical protein [Deltaproteobacteria bacterium]
MSDADNLFLTQNQELKRIEDEVDIHRKRFTESVTLLKTHVEDLGSWRMWVARMPWRALLGGVMVGWAVGHMGGRRRH